MNKIVLDNVTIGYNKKIVAENLSAEIRGEEMTCLIGRNGTGKSTLLKTIAGFIPPLTGNITITHENKENNLSTLSKEALSKLVAVVLTNRIDITNITAKEVIGMGRMPYTGFFGRLSKKDWEIVSNALEVTGTVRLADRDISTLSDGERQKIMIAKALVQQTPVILLDEPTAFLDYDNKKSTMQLLASLAHDFGKIILASTHDLEIALRNADRMITIDNGIKDVSKDYLVSKITPND